MRKKIVFSLFLVLFVGISGVFAQNVQPDYLKGLKKLTKKDSSSKGVQMDGESVPIYDNEGKRLQGEEIMKALISGSYVPEIYVDKNKEPKAIVFRLAKGKEKAQLARATELIRSDNKELLDKKAPSFSVTDIEGSTYSLDELKGKVVVLNFWFTHCKPCVKEMPELNKVVNKFKSKGVIFLAFALDKKEALHKFLAKTPFSYHIVAESQSIADKYKVGAFPTHVIIDKDSKVVLVKRGLYTSDIEEKIEQLLGK